jgi:hypothetical protein
MARLGQKIFDWGVMKKEQMKIRIFQVFSKAQISKISSTFFN